MSPARAEPGSSGDLRARVTGLAVGTAGLGMSYGISAPGAAGRPSSDRALRILQNAVEARVSLFDTAPAYGRAEELLGNAELGHALVATKVPPLHGPGTKERVLDSLGRSADRLGRRPLDIVQIHNATPQVLDGPLPDALEEAREEGAIDHLGATVYEPSEARAVLADPGFEVLQIPFNPYVADRWTPVLDRARRAGVTVVARSVLLKGALTPKVHHLPDDLGALGDAATRIVDGTDIDGDQLPQLAIRYALDTEGIDCVLVGVQTGEELAQAVAARDAETLPQEVRRRMEDAYRGDMRWLDPRNWDLGEDGR